MGLLEILGLVMTGLKFLPVLVEFIKLLQSTPEEKRADLIEALRAASKKADETKGDTSGYEDLLKGR